jgi:AraC-like DNA-binding protein
VRAPYYRIAAERGRRVYRLAVEQRVPLADAERAPLLEMLLLSLQALVESVLGRPLREAAFDFAYPAPPYAARYRHFFHAPVRFGRPETGAALPVAWLDLLCPMADPAMYRASLETLETQARRLEGEDFLLARLEQILAAAGDAGLPLAEAARRVRLSRRTLNRRLAELGTSYRAELDAHLRGRAEALLRDPGLSVGEVAWRLGYEDPSNFGRACRRWFGAGPARRREQLLGARER